MHSRVTAGRFVLRFGALFSVLLFAVPRAAHADWLFGGYMGASATASNTLTVTPAGGPPSTISNVAYRGQAFRSPVYYGVRVSLLPARDVTGVVVPEIEWTHAKAIAQIDPRAQGLSAFQQSHGLNFLLGNVAYRFTPACDGRCTLVVRGGAGISTPHVESTFRNTHQEQYQYGGFAWQVGAGAEFRIWQFVYGIADARITRVNEKRLRAAAADISGAFFTRHVDFGIGLRLPD
jgi:hypothetical protein